MLSPMYPGGHNQPRRPQQPPYGHPPQAYPYAGPPYGGYPPPQNSGGSGCGLAALIVTVVLVVVVGIVGLGGLVLVRAINTAATPTGQYATPNPTTGTAGAPASDETTTSSTPTTRPMPRGEAALGDNPLFRGSVIAFPATQCSPPGVPEDPQRGATFFAAVQRCLDSGWRQLIEGAGFTFTSPTLKVTTTDKVTSACGTVDLVNDNVGAFYCPADRTMYMAYTPEGVLRSVKPGSIAGDYVAVFAHEYGHHVQNLTGTSSAYGARLTASGGADTAAGQEARCRMELQGACFAGLATGGIYRGGAPFDESDVPTLFATQHISNNNLAWWKLGYTQNNVSLCNTWVAPANTVTDN